MTDRNLSFLQVVAIAKQPDINPYIAINVDEIAIARTQTKLKSVKPVWNEEFSTEVHSGQSLGFTVFHDAHIPPDEFVANCTINFEEIVDKKISDIWVKLSAASV